MSRVAGKGAGSHPEKMYDGEKLNEQGGPESNFRQRTKDSQERARVEADRRVQAAGGGAAAEKERLAQLKAQNVRPKGSGSQRWRPKSEQELTTQARYEVRQRGQEALKNNPNFQAPEKAKTDSKPDPKPDGGGGGGNTPPRPAAKTTTATNASGQQQQVTVGRRYDATLGGQKGTVTYDAAGKRTFTANKPVAGDTAPAKPTNGAVADRTTTPAPKTANPLLKDNSISDMIRASQMRQRGDNVTSDNVASVRQSVQQANRPEVLNRQAPAGSALRAQQDRLAAQRGDAASASSALSGRGALSSSGGPRLAVGGQQPAPRPAAGAGIPAPRPVGTPIQGGSGIRPVAGAPTSNAQFSVSQAPRPAAAAPAPRPAAGVPAPAPRPVAGNNVRPVKRPAASTGVANRPNPLWEGKSFNSFMSEAHETNGVVYEGWGSALGKVARVGGRAIPVVGNVLMGIEAVNRARKGDWGGAALSAAGAIPGPIGYAALGADIARELSKGQPAQAKPANTQKPANTPKPANTSAPASTPKPANTPAQTQPKKTTVLAKKGGVQGTLDKATGKFTAQTWNDKQSSRYSSYKK